MMKEAKPAKKIHPEIIQAATVLNKMRELMSQAPSVDEASLIMDEHLDDFYMMELVATAFGEVGGAVLNKDRDRAQAVLQGLINELGLWRLPT